MLCLQRRLVRSCAIKAKPVIIVEDWLENRALLVLKTLEERDEILGLAGSDILITEGRCK